MHDTAAIIVAAGRGTRAGAGLPKQWRPLMGRSVLARTLSVFTAHPEVGRVILVVHPDERADAARIAPDAQIVAGGASRGASVRAGLEAMEASPPARVLIHDAARPLVRPELVSRVVAALDTAEGAAPGIAISDAIWRADAGCVDGILDRAGLWRAQTPQGFRYAGILQAHRDHGDGAADDVAVACAARLDVAIVAGDEDNLKITTAADFDRAARILERREAPMDVRTGTGFDVHAFAPGQGVTLCGVTIPFDRRLSGHSDADVAMHALTDAIYGALAEGDIGRHFPPSEPRWKGADSRVFLEHAAGRAALRGYAIANADLTIICEAPKIGPHAAAMTECLGGVLGIARDRISVKATTSEGLGFTGRQEGIAAMAAVTLAAR